MIGLDRVKPVLLCLLIISPQLAHSQAWMNCPVPIQSGTWTIAQTGPIASMISTRMGGMATSTPSGSVTTAEVSSDGCTNIFSVSVSGQTFDLQPSDPLPTEVGAFYEGYFEQNNLEFGLRLKLLGPDVAEGRYGLSDLFVGAVAEGLVGVEMRSKLPVSEGGYRPECNCPTELRAFIAESVAEAEFWIDIYSNPKFRQVPDGIDSGKWFAPGYDNLIDLMFEGELNDLTYEAAVTILNGSEPVPEGQFQSMDDESLLTSNTDGEQAGSVNVSTCGHSIGDEHYKKCFWTIGYESTLTHEFVHKAQCNQIDCNPFNVDCFADREIDAYQAEIDLLKRFIPDNCPSN